ncbi:MAG TPA: sarcosine oxidase subunit gamma [Amaricoccus sp.]|uniref:sarcosine oxidase subunit gamma n=1 Tax=Amaricoccus sp. TaxID=1872485 RepID=UPI002B90C645|nr:sarcosine oxidase subunit gamma [Amaricoccus sp.]HMR54961.1 sarcosine oxidase subunit gamma [Amaricoccus sp.]HMU01964.1 sarcosine oxidase subunit gamma [Amaricoccus sp.]
MAELAFRSPFAGLDLPVETGGARLAGLPRTPILAIAPFRGREAAVSDALSGAIGAGLPPVGRWTRLGEGRLSWAGSGQWLLTGPAAASAAPALAGLAALADQGDGWAGMVLDGKDARDVLARLLPLDLDPAASFEGAAARSLLRHVPCLLLAAGPGWEIWVQRSFTRTAVHEIAGAMRSLAGRRALERGDMP